MFKISSKESENIKYDHLILGLYMSIQDAMKFIQEVGNNKKLKDKIRSLGDSGDLEEVIRIGVGEGFDFSIEEFRTAFAKDWEVRRNLYSSKALK